MHATLAQSLRTAERSIVQSPEQTGNLSSGDPMTRGHETSGQQNQAPNTVRSSTSLLCAQAGELTPFLQSPGRHPRESLTSCRWGIVLVTLGPQRSAQNQAAPVNLSD